MGVKEPKKDLEPMFIGYERENTGRMCFMDAAGDSVQVTSRFNYQPGHPDEIEQGVTKGYVYLLTVSACVLTKAQAKELAKHLARFARSGSILGAREKPRAR